MKALVYTGPKQLAYRDEPDPTPADDEVLFRVDAVGVCGSDLHAFLGHDERRPAPLILGHEAAGEVVGGALDGRKMVVNPLVTCGACDACLTGRSNLCAHREIISMAPRQGAFAQFIAIPERNLVPVPDSMDMTKAALAEPIATAWHAVTKAAGVADRPLAECKALVFGGGAVGLSAALCLHAQGCHNILLAETNTSRHATAAKTDICTPFDPVTDSRAPDNGIDVVIDCVGGAKTRRAASLAVRPGGVIIHVGLMDSAEGLDVRKLTLQEVAFIGTYTYTMTDFKATVAAMHAGHLGALDWYDERALAYGFEAVNALVDGHVSSAKIVLRPE